MSNVRRVYVEKKPAFAVKAKELKHEIKHYLGISTVTAVRELIRYDVENISDEVFEKACKTVFAEPPVDDLYLEKFDVAEGARVFSVEFLPGLLRTLSSVPVPFFVILSIIIILCFFVKNNNKIQLVSSYARNPCK